MQEKIKTGIAILTVTGLLVGAYADMRSQIDVLNERVDRISLFNDKLTATLEKLSDNVGQLGIIVARLDERTREDK